MKRVVIVGGGIGGLTMALHLKDRASELTGGLEVSVMEGSDRPGGNIQTDRAEGFTIEKGPNGYLDNFPTTPSLVRRLGLEDQLQKADESAAKRYLYRGGKLHLLPSGPLGFLTSSILSLPGRLRVFGEPLARRIPEGVDETIFEFASRRIGEEAASVLIDAMVSGVFAGNIHELSLSSSLPKMAAMEEEHGGLVMAMLARMRERRTAKREVEERRLRGEKVEELVQPGGPAGPGGTLTGKGRGGWLGWGCRWQGRFHGAMDCPDGGRDDGLGRCRRGRGSIAQGRTPSQRSRQRSFFRHRGDCHGESGRGGPGLRRIRHGWHSRGLRIPCPQGDRASDSRVPLGLQHLPWSGTGGESAP